MTTGFVYDPRFLQHVTGPNHPERPHRLTAIVAHLRQTGLWEQLHHLSFEPAEVATVCRIHDPAYLQRLHASCWNNEMHIDAPDSAICADSYDVALLAVGGVLAAVDAVMQGPPTGVHNAFCAVRPPGHHAEYDHSMGFCLLNNVAIAAQYLLDKHHLQRVAVVDFDVHHANGTQHAFESRADVLCITLHEHPATLYPGTGYAWEKGVGPGAGYTLNIPLESGAGDGAYQDALATQVLPALDQYQPQFLLLSAGFDAAGRDPLAHLNVTREGFIWITQQLKQAAEKHCQGRLVSVLEGGYDLHDLAQNVAAHIGALLQTPNA